MRIFFLEMLIVDKVPEDTSGLSFMRILSGVFGFLALGVLQYVGVFGSIREGR